MTIDAHHFRATMARLDDAENDFLLQLLEAEEALAAAGAKLRTLRHVAGRMRGDAHALHSLALHIVPPEPQKEDEGK